jgi:hypothetical protein
MSLPKVEDIKPNSGRVLLVLSPDRKIPPEDARRLFAAVPQKNNFCVVTGDGSDMGNLEEKVRRIWAIAKVREEDGGDKSPNRSQLDEDTEQAEFDFNSTLVSLFNRVFYPGRHPREGEGLLFAPLKLTPMKAKEGPDAINGETAVEDALASTGASKLERELNDANVDKLRSRAEDLLWISGDRRMRWKDVEEQAICTFRWPWLPPKGLDDLKRRAIGTGDWRDTGDGYVEKGSTAEDRREDRHALAGRPNWRGDHRNHGVERSIRPAVR